jgi:uncharacterized membrane protein
MQVLDIIMRIVHIGSAVLMGGGIALLVMAVLPALRQVGDEQRRLVLEATRRRFVPLMHGALTLLIISGVYNWWRNTPTYRLLKEAEASAAFGTIHGLLGLKVIAAALLIVFLVLFGIRARRGEAGRWLVTSLLVIAAVIIMAAVVRALRLYAIGL